MPCTFDVNVDVQVEIGVAGIQKLRQSANASIADQRIQLAKTLHAFFGNQAHGLRIGHITDLRKHFHAVGILNLCCHFMDRLIKIYQDQVGPVFCVDRRMRLTHSF
ncbi:hypothetical protein D3C87_1793430 [compost metagenome]